MVIVNKRKFYSKITIFILLILVVFLSVTPIKKAIYPLRYEDIIVKYSNEYQLDPYLVMAIISAESRFEENANSHKDAMGLMQVTEQTAKWCVDRFELDISSENLYNPDTNIHIGCAYMDFLIDVFDGELQTAVAAYNAGQGNVKKWLSDERYSLDGKTLKQIPFEETKNYVEKVLKRYEIYKKLY